MHPLARPNTPGAFYHGLRLMAIDGTVLNVPDTPRNAETFGRPSGGERGEGAFPQVRKLSLVEVGTHVEVGLSGQALSVQRTGDVARAAALIFAPEMLLMWDRNFFSYELWKTLNFAGNQGACPVAAGLILRPIQRLSDGSYLAKIYPNAYARKKDRHGIVVRVIKYTLDDPQRVGHGEEHTLMTNLLDEKLYPAGELIRGYHERWEHELVYDEQKTHQDPRRATKPAHLRSETPDGRDSRVVCFVVGAFCGSSVDVRGCTSGNVSIPIDFPSRVVFTSCNAVCRSATAGTDQSFAAWCDRLLWELGQERTEPRRNRINPRVIKQKISKWPKKRSQHRHPPPLTKTFMQSVVMLN